ncbi:MAG: PadR family transcriptional regulator [Ruminococcus sp.]|nr:PadR family transcriptional regulator [Ruminococcus sp.]
MGFPISAALLDSMVLAIVEKEDTYGYEITRNLREVADVSESTLYPVLRRLQKNMLLETYDREYMGRNRRYYRVTAKGITALDDYRAQWQHHKEMIDSILEK